MGNIDILCQHLQQKLQYILNVIQLVSNTKAFIKKFRDENWNNLLEKLVFFLHTI